MYLKTLTLRGFKSFGTATTLRFEPGITCIVGPNGSGKSNVVDALTWVMGEQGPKSLRGASMADVIFAGTPERPALGRAQVELTIDNSDGRLPIEYSEVRISRTMFRGGGSDYAINGSPARLLDVQELLSDTGMGRQMHVVVGQGQLDAVLRASPEDRREFIDEAAGVLKHRRRKERALRKLGAMDQNLLRVVDLTEEIGRQLRPLARQAKAARAAAGIQERLREAQLRVFTGDLVAAESRAAQDQQQVSQLREEWSAREEETRQEEKRVRELAASQQRLAEYASQLSEAGHQFDALQERLGSISSVAAERLNQAGVRALFQSEEVVAEAEEESRTAAAGVTRLEEELRAGREQAARTEALRREAAEKYAAAQQALRAEEVALEQERERSQATREREVAAAARVAAGEAAVTQMQGRLAASEARVAEAESRAVPPIADRAVSAEDLRERHQLALDNVEECAGELERLQDEERLARVELGRAQGRQDTLERALSGAVPAGSGTREHFQALTTIDEQLHVERGWEQAVTALLGAFERALVVDEEAFGGEALAAWQEAGTPATVWASTEPSPGSDAELGRTDTPGVPARSAVTGPSSIRPALDQLLSGAWLAEDVAEASALLRSEPEARAVATRDGAVLTKWTLRGPDPEQASLLQLRSDLEDARGGTVSAKETVQVMNQAAAAARGKLEDARKEAAEVRTAWEAAEREAAERERAYAQHAAQVDAIRAEAERAREELLDAEEKLAALRRDLEEARATAADTPGVPKDLSASRQVASEAERALQELREQEMRDRVALGAGEEKLLAAERAAQAAQTRFAHLARERSSGLVREAELERVRAKLAEIRNTADSARERAREHAAWCGDQRERVLLEAAGLKSTHDRTAEKLERLRWEQLDTSGRRQQAEVAIAQVEAHLERLREDLIAVMRDGLSYDEDIEAPDGQLLDEARIAYGPDQPVVGPDGEKRPYLREEMLSQLETAQKELDRLGVVNPLAVKEYEALHARKEFMEEQVSDLRKSKADVLAIIADVDERVRAAFLAAFADTQRHFEEVFAALFPGGKGRLTLTDPDDPLTTGVEIYARPAGKRVTRLSLLSGGERSLAALAYLVAIFRARPSPFYVLDEVEAALDDTNLSRVLEVLDDLREASQLIVVTHQKRTMEIADALYGVTMREGVSEVVSHRM